MTNPLESWMSAPVRRRMEPMYWGGNSDILKYATALRNNYNQPSLLGSSGPLGGGVLGNPLAPPSAQVAIPNPFVYRLGDPRTMTLIGGIYWPYHPFPSGLYWIPGEVTSAMQANQDAAPLPFASPFVSGDVVLTTSDTYFNRYSGTFKPDEQPIAGFAVITQRNRNGYTPGSAASYSLSVEVDGATVWTGTIDPLAYDRSVFWIPRSPPWDAAIFRARITVSGDASHPHTVRTVCVPRAGLYVKKQALPSGFLSTLVSAVTAVNQSGTSSAYHGKTAATGVYASGPSRFVSSGTCGLSSIACPLSSPIDYAPTYSRVQTASDILPVSNLGAYEDYIYGSGITSPFTVETASVYVAVYLPDAAGVTVTAYSYANWGREDRSGASTVVGTISLSGGGVWATGTMTITAPPKGGGRVRVAVTAGSWGSVYGTGVKDYDEPPARTVVTAEADGTWDIVPGGIHADSLVAPYAFTKHEDGPDGGAEIEIDTSGYSNGDHIIFVNWKGCNPGLFAVQKSTRTGSWSAYANTTSALTGAALSSILGGVCGYAHEGVRGAAIAVTMSGGSPSAVRVKTILCTEQTPYALAVGSNAITTPAAPASPSGLSGTPPHLVKFTAPADGSYRLIFNMRGSSGNVPPPIIYSDAAILHKSNDRDGYGLSYQPQALPSGIDIRAQIAYAAGSVSVTGVSTSVPTTSTAAPARLFYAISAAIDWTGTAWEGHGGDIATCLLYQRSSSSPYPIPSDQIWEFISTNDGEYITYYDSGISNYRIIIRDGSYPNGWRPIDPTIGLDFASEVVALASGQSVQYRIAKVSDRALGGMPLAAWAGSAFGASARIAVTVEAIA